MFNESHWAFWPLSKEFVGMPMSDCKLAGSNDKVGLAEKPVEAIKASQCSAVPSDKLMIWSETD